MRQDFGHLFARDAVGPGALEVVEERGIGDALADQGGDGDNGTDFERKRGFTRPDLSEEDIVVQLGKFRPRVYRGRRFVFS